MKSLETLLKVAQRRLDELGVEAAKIVQGIEAMKAEEEGLLQRELAEVQSASHDLTIAPMMPAYRARMKHARGQVRLRILEAEKTLEIVRGKLSEAYQEKAKFKEMLDQMRARETAERLAREQAQLDEAAINLANRN
jgi:flagellar export protein FliJ